MELSSEKSHTKLSQFLKEKEQDSSWLVEALVLQPGLLLKETDDGLVGNEGGVRNVVEDDTCRVGSIHCDHVKGIVALLVLTIAFSPIWYYFVIYRPSKKRQQENVQEIPANHSFVFSRSLGASTHRSTASSFYGGTRRLARPGQNEEVNMGDVQYEYDESRVGTHAGNQVHLAVQYDENSQRGGTYAGTQDMYRTSNQHPASYV